MLVDYEKRKDDENVKNCYFSYDVYKGMFAVCCKNLAVNDKDGQRIWTWMDGR